MCIKHKFSTSGSSPVAIALRGVRAPFALPFFPKTVGPKLYLHFQTRLAHTFLNMTEEVSTPVAAPASPKKGKGSAKATKPRKPKTAPSHPKVSEMVTTAIKTLKERSGSSTQAIKKYIAANYKVDIDRLAPFIKKFLKSAVESGALTQTKGVGASGSFRIAGAAKPASTGKPKKATKPAAKKPKSATPKKAKAAAKPKKPAAEKKAAKKPKASAPKKAKTVKKPKAVTPKKPKAPKAAKKTPVKKATKAKGKK